MSRPEFPEGWTAQAYRFALEPSPADVRMLESHCGAASFAFDHMLAHVKAVMGQRQAERTYRIGDPELIPAQDWSLAALRREWNRRKATVAPWWQANEIHMTTSKVAAQHQVVGAEHLNVDAMRRRGGVRKRALNPALGDAALGRIRGQLSYKTSWNDATLVVAPRNFPSTQLCSRCGVKTRLRPRDRAYHCRNGCPPIDRDLNAAINLARLGDPASCGRGTGTGTGSRPAANRGAGDGRRANQKITPATAAMLAGGDESSTPHSRRTDQTGTVAPQGEAA
jgi:putative transposase